MFVMIQSNNNNYYYWSKIIILIIIIRFRGELFGLGTNHTKYKSKSYNNMPTNPSQPTQLQYNNAVHHPNNNIPNNNITVGGGNGNNFGYDEGY